MKRYDLSGRVAIVTGASKGIGKAIAQGLGEAGAKVVVSSRKQEAVDLVATELREQGIEATAFACNVSHEEEIAKLVEGTIATYQRLDIIVNNAGTNLTVAPLLEVDDRTFNKMMDVNVKGALWLSRYAQSHLKANGGGSIINIASIEGITPSDGLGIYSLTKAALIMATKVLARELGSDQIRVNAVCPGYIKTKLSASVMEDPDKKAEIMAKQTLAHEARPEDIIGVTLLLASDAGAFFSGSIITADGGFTV